MERSGFVSEVFLSIQGEGLYVGKLQLFVRVAGCSLGCIYCDTDRGRPNDFPVGEGTRRVRNPVCPGELARIAADVIRTTPAVHSISLTGGEPLEQPDFVAAFLERCRSLGRPLYLETNGLSAPSLERIAPLVDIISLDIKLPSLCGGGDLFGRYQKTLPLMRGGDLFCKIVLSEGFDPSEFSRALDLIANADDRIPLVIQPATPVEGCRSVDPGLLIDLYGEAVGRLRDVRIIPQCHGILGLR